MVRNYVKKTQRQEWSVISMQEAVNAVINGSMGYKKAAIQFQVPQTTLERHVKKKREDTHYVVTKSMGYFTCVFNTEQEAELVQYLIIMEAQLFGLTINELRELAFQLAERNNIKHPFREDAASSEVYETGWITKELFLKWFEKFISFSGASKEKPVLLLLDGHATHTKSLPLIDLARQNGVILLCLPPHCSHKLQPLDVSYMKPLSKYYEDEVRTWLRSNPGKVITLFQVASLFGGAYMRASTMSTAVNGFRKTGIWPVNINVFTDADFLPSATTEIKNPVNITNEANASTSSEPLNNILPTTPLRATNTDLPTCSGTVFQNVSPEVILPIPTVDQKNKSFKKKGQKCNLNIIPLQKGTVGFCKRKHERVKRQLALQQPGQEEAPPK